MEHRRAGNVIARCPYHMESVPCIVPVLHTVAVPCMVSLLYGGGISIWYPAVLGTTTPLSPCRQTAMKTLTFRIIRNAVGPTPRKLYYEHYLKIILVILIVIRDFVTMSRSLENNCAFK